MADRSERFLARMEQTIIGVAVASCKTPKARDDFEYGRVCGMVQGLELAKKVFDEILDEEDENGKHKRPKIG